MKINSKKLKFKVSQGIFSGLVVLTTLFSGCGFNNKLVNKKSLEHPYIGTTFVSDQVVEHGGAVRENVRQDILGFSLNDKVSGYFWQNYSFKEKAISERDFRIWYSHPLNKNFSINAGYHLFDYPTGTFGDYDSAFIAEAICKKMIDFYLDFTQLIPNKNTERGIRIYVRTNKRIPIMKNRSLEIVLTPSLSTSYVNNFLGVSGFSQITPGINLEIDKKSFYLNLFINNQNSIVPKIQNFNWNGVGVGYKF